MQEFFLHVPGKYCNISALDTCITLISVYYILLTCLQDSKNINIHTFESDLEVINNDQMYYTSIIGSKKNLK